MKKWYSNLEKRYLVHIVLVLINILLLFAIGVSDEGDSIGLMILLFLLSLILEIIFIVFEYKLRTKKENLKENTKNSIEENDNKKIESNSKFNVCTEYDGQKYALKYSYKENLCFINNLDKVNLDSYVTFRLNESNKYDPETVEVYCGEYIIGLMYKGTCRDIIVACIKNNKYVASGFVCKKDDENLKISIMVGVYIPLERRKSFVCPLINTSKKDYSGEKRQDNVEFLTEGDILNLEQDSDTLGLLVLNKYYSELGEISVRDTRIINEDTDDISKIIVIVDNISYTDTQVKAKVKLRVYLTEEEKGV